MSVYNLSHLLRPTRLALVARRASMTPGDRVLLANLCRTAAAELTVADPDGGARPADLDPRVRWVPAVAGLAPQTDLVVSALPLAETPKLLAQLGALGARTLIATRPRRSPGDDALEAAVRAAARTAGVRVLGLNSFGVACPATGLNASRFEAQPEPGRVALISQSGSLTSTILDMARQRSLGFSHVISLGSLLDVDFGDIIDHLAWEPEVRCLMLYVENLASVKKFLSACRAAARSKPVVAVKGGSSDRGRRLIASHTGREAGEDAVYDTAFRRAGVIRVDSVRELVASAEALSRSPLPRGNRLAVVSNSGGIGVLVADNLAARGAQLAELSAELRHRLAAFVTPAGADLNPVCIGSNADPERYLRLLERLLDSGEVDTVLVVMALSKVSSPERVVEGLRPRAAARKVEVVYIWHGNRAEHAATARRLAGQGDVIYPSVEEATTAYAYAHRYTDNLAKVVAVPPRFDRTLEYRREDAAQHLAELQGGTAGAAGDLAREAWLAAYGLPLARTRRADTLAGLTAAAAETGYPVALRTIGPGAGRGAGGARVWNPEQLPGAYRRLGGEGVPVTLQRVVRDARYLLKAGVRTDVEFGPFLYLGTGGLPPGAREDEEVILPPLNRLLARRLIDRSGLAGRMALADGEAEQLEELLVRLSQLVVDTPAVRELELDPLTLCGDGFRVQASRLQLQTPRHASPHHLVTAPYPNQYEFQETLKDGTPVLVRPIRPEDGESHFAFFNALSSRTVYNRFFGYRAELSAEQMVGFTQIDYAREVALVARVEQGGEEVTIGVNRLTYDPHNGHHEFAVVVADAWQGSGVGRLLMEKIVEIAVDRGIHTIEGMILAGNPAMLGLARGLGFTVVERDQEALTVRLEC